MRSRSVLVFVLLPVILLLLLLLCFFLFITIIIISLLLFNVKVFLCDKQLPGVADVSLTNNT